MNLHYQCQYQYNSDRAWQLRDLDGMPVGAVTLPGDVFNVPVRVDVMHQVWGYSQSVGQKRERRGMPSNV